MQRLPRQRPTGRLSQVTLTTPQSSDWRSDSRHRQYCRLAGGCDRAELPGLRLTEVLVNVGDRVSKGQELARTGD
jgi:biotin carboxyl carrier protein